MNDIVYNISLDMYETMSQCVIPVKEADNGRKINFMLSEGGKPYKIEEGDSAVLRARKGDGTVLFNNCIIDGNTIKYTLTNQTSSVAGVVECELTLSDSNQKRITSPRFSLLVEETVYSDDEIESKDEFTALQTAIRETNTLDIDIEKKDSETVVSLTKKDGEIKTVTVKDGEKGEKGDFPDVDTGISETSENPVQNKAIASALNSKVDKIEGKGLSTNDFTDDYKSFCDTDAIAWFLLQPSDNGWLGNKGLVYYDKSKATVGNITDYVGITDTLTPTNPTPLNELIPTAQLLKDTHNTPRKFNLVKTITTTERVSTITETFDAVQKLFVYVTVPVDTEYTSGKTVTIYLSVPGISNKVYSTQIANGAGLTERYWFFEVDFSDNIPRWAFSTVGNNATARINETWQTGINFFTAMLGKEFTVNGFTLSCDNAEFCEGTKIDIYAM